MKLLNRSKLAKGLLLSFPLWSLPLNAAILVNLDATSLPPGPLPAWTNTGTVVGNFTATGSPAVASVAGLNAVTLAGSGDFYAGPLASAPIAGANPVRSIEVWAHNPSIAAEETLVAWGRRNGPDGSNMAFNYGNHGSFGAVGHWGGGPDLGWNNAGGAPSAGAWHYLVYTYDGTTTRVYADGVLQNSEAVSLNTHEDLPFVIGGQNNELGTPIGFNSGLSIARARVHDTVLSAGDIATNYDTERATLFPGATLDSSRVVSTSAVSFTITDIPPASVTNPGTFAVTVGGTVSHWTVPGGEGILNGSITTPTLLVPNNGPVTLTLKHRFNIEGDNWDGAVVQVSVDGGAFTTLESTNFTQNGYQAGPLIGNHVLTGQLAWGGASPGFGSGDIITSIATIPNVEEGSEVEVRFLGAWDEGFTPEGPDWEIFGVKVTAGGAVMIDENFSEDDGGFASESTAPGGTWNFLLGNQPVLGTLTPSKTGNTLTLTQAINWAPGRTYTFTITGQDAEGDPLSYMVNLTTPSLPLGAPRTWPAILPGPLGTPNSWGVRTYLNSGLVAAEDLTAALDFLAASADRTPALSPTNVIDTAEPTLNFVDPSTNGTGGIVTGDRPFPGDALSTSTNGGAARDDNHVVTSAHGVIQITEASDYTFNFHGDDGFMFRIKAASGPHPKFAAVGGAGSVDPVQQNLLYFPSGTGDHNTRGIVHLTPGTYKLEYATWEGVGGFFYEVSAAKGFFPGDGDTTTWRAVGYQVVPFPSSDTWTVLSTPPGAVTNFTLPGADAAVDAAVAADAVAATSMWPQINFRDPESGGTGRIPGDVPWPRNTAADDNQYAMRMSSTLTIPVSGNYLIGFQGDDGTRLTVGGTHGGFSALVENATGAGTIGRGNTIAVNQGSLGAAVNFSPVTAASWSQPGAIAGDANTAVGTTGGATRLRVPLNTALNPSTAFSVELWAKPATVPGGLTCVCSSGNFANPRMGWLIYMDPAAGWNFRGYNGINQATVFNISTGGAPVAGNWYHIVATWTGSEAIIYVNGAASTPASGVTTYVPATTSLSDGSLTVGARADNAFAWSGVVDELAIYPAALDPGTINTHSDNGGDPDRLQTYPSLVLESNPLGYWRFGETLQPFIDLGTITTDVATGNSSTVGRIFLEAGSYPISATFWENGGGSYIEIFAAPDTAGAGFRVLGAASPDFSGLPLVTHPTPAPAPPTSGLVIQPGGALSVTFASVPYATYSLECSTDMVTWVVLNNDIQAATTGNSTTYTGVVDESFFVAPTDRRAYYRIIPNP